MKSVMNFALPKREACGISGRFLCAIVVIDSPSKVKHHNETPLLIDLRGSLDVLKLNTKSVQMRVEMSALDELEQREGVGTLFVQPIITRCSSTSCWPE